MAFWRNSTPAHTKATASKTLKNFDDNSKPSHYHSLAKRHNQHKHIIKGLTEYYAQLQAQWTQAAKDAETVAGNLPLPFHEGEQFLSATDAGGWQYALYAIKEKTRAVAATYSDLAKQVERAVVAPLNLARQDIKSYLAQLDKDMGKLTNDVDKSREDTAAALVAHSDGIAVSEGLQHSAQTSRQDPFVTNGVAILHLQTQAELENRLTRTVLQYQQLSLEAEIKMTRAIQDAAKAFLDIQLSGDVRLKFDFAAIEEAIASVSPDREWDHYKSDNTRILSSQTAIQDAAEVTFPQQDHPTARTILEGQLERQKGITRAWAPFHFVLTPAGFLHQYPSTGLEGLTNPSEHIPSLSIFLSDFTLSEPSPENDVKGQRFTLLGARGSATGKDSKQGIVGTLGLGKAAEVGYTFKAKDRSTMLDWHEAIAKHVRATATADVSSVRSPTSPRSVSAASSFFDEDMRSPAPSPALAEEQTPVFLSPAGTPEVSEQTEQTPTLNSNSRRPSAYEESITEPDSPGLGHDTFEDVSSGTDTEAIPASTAPPLPTRKAPPPRPPTEIVEETAASPKSKQETPKSPEVDTIEVKVNDLSVTDDDLKEESLQDTK